MPKQLPEEVVHAIVHALADSGSPNDLLTLTLVSPTFARQSRLHLLTHPDIRSSASAKLVQANQAVSEQARTLTVQPGRRTRLEKKRIGRKTVEEWVEDAVTEDDLVQLCAKLRKLEAVHLIQPVFTSLRRRQINFLSHLTSLHTLSICGRPSDSGVFTLQTVGRILLTLPHLKHLTLRHLDCRSTSLDGLSFPTYNLVSFSLFSCPDITDKQLYWLLHPVIYSESLRRLSFGILPPVKPSRLYPVRWAPVRTTSVYLETDQAQAIETLPIHLPSIRYFSFRTRARLDPARLFASCTTFNTTESLIDYSDRGCGLPLRALAEAVLSQKRSRAGGVRAVAIRRERRHEDEFVLLKAVCEYRGVALRLVSGAAE
ncbi:hypothetical protein JCM10207_000459 [Rhodosporidiobolus poonsookiae]